MKRILVLGSAGHSRHVTAHTWDRLPRDLNVADYDRVVLNLVPLHDPDISKICDTSLFPSSEQFARLLFAPDAEVVVIGSPGAMETTVTFCGHPGKGSRDLMWFLPSAPKIRFESGEVICNVEKEFQYYFEFVKRWSFWAESQSQQHALHPQWFAEVGYPEANRLKSRTTHLASTRFGRPVAFVLRYRLSVTEELARVFTCRAPRVRDLAESGELIWLPAPTECSDHEAVELVLTTRYGILAERERPLWVEQYRLPRQEEVHTEIVRLQADADKLSRELELSRKKLNCEGRYHKLLYEQGEPLEAAVRQVLREFGASVTDPVETGRDDGCLVEPKGRHAKLEIKGVTSSISLKHVRQLLQWVQEPILEEQVECKGLLIANTYCTMALEDRQAPFPSNCISAAERFGLCLLTTSSLFRAVLELQKGTFDAARFWDHVFTTTGVCELAEP